MELLYTIIFLTIFSILIGITGGHLGYRWGYRKGLKDCLNIIKEEKGNLSNYAGYRDKTGEAFLTNLDTDLSAYTFVNDDKSYVIQVEDTHPPILTQRESEPGEPD